MRNESLLHGKSSIKESHFNLLNSPTKYYILHSAEYSTIISNDNEVEI